METGAASLEDYLFASGAGDRPGSAQDPPADVSRALYLVALSDTYARARRGCRRYAGYSAESVRSFADFEALPLLRRADLDRDLPSVCMEGVPVEGFSATSATTTGFSLYVPHSPVEEQSLRRYHALLGGAPQRDEVLFRLMPCGRLTGESRAGGGPHTVRAAFDTNAVREGHWDTWCYLAGQLFAEFPVHGKQLPISIVHATPAFGLILLTKYMVERGLSPAESAVRKLVVTGSWIGRHTRRWIEQSWNAALFTSYSCSELSGWAPECRAVSGRYHFDHTIYPEVLAADRDVAVAPGEQGRLVLTGLHPFQQATALIRYEVGDWARWRGDEVCACGVAARTIDFLGRTKGLQWAPLPGGRLPLPAAPILDVLDGFEAVPKVPRPQFAVQVVSDGARPRIVLHVECFALGGAPWRQRLQSAIRDAWCGEYAELREALARGEVDCEVALHSRSQLTITVSVI